MRARLRRIGARRIDGRCLAPAVNSPHRGRAATATAAAILVALLAADAFARAGGGGNFGGGGGGGGGHGGGGGDGGAIIWLFIQLVRLCFTHPVIGLPLMALFLWFVWHFWTRARTGYTGSVIRRGGIAANVNASVAAAAKLAGRDPAFQPVAFFARVQTAFRTAQSAWCAHDLTPIRPFVSDGVYERFQLQVDEQKALGYRDRMDDLSVDDVKFDTVEFDGAFDVVTVRITATADDRRVSLDGGRSVPGGVGREQFSELWTFVRRRGARTAAGKLGLLEGNCPNCGAGIEGNQFEDCKSCGARLRSGEFDWVLVEITQAGERSGRRSREVPGVPELQARDPEFCVQQLEDRSSVVFWRWATAMRFGDAKPLAGVATPEVAGQVARDAAETGGVRRYVGECGVGGVEVIGVLMEGAPETAVVEVRWSGTDFETRTGRPAVRTGRTGIRTWLFVFERKAGTQSRLADSFSSAHCRGCGAPAARDSAECSYCGVPLADVNHGWTLARMTTRFEAAGRLLIERIAGGPAGAAEAVEPPPVPQAVPVGVLTWAAHVAASDGQVDAKERAAFGQLAARAGIARDRAEEMLADAQAGGEPVVPQTTQAAREWLEFAARIALADGQVTPEEFALLQRLAGPAGMSAADVRILMNRVRAQMYVEARAEIARAKAG